MNASAAAAITRFVLFCLTLLTGAAPLAVAQPDQDTIRRAIMGSPISINPQAAFDDAGKAIIYDLYEGLVSFAPDGRVIPGVATHWDVSADGLVYTFHLDPAAQWSNADRVTAHDFVASWRNLLDPDTAAPFASLAYAIKNARPVLQGAAPPEALGVTASSDTVLVVELEKPIGFFTQVISHYAFMPLHSSAISRPENEWITPGELVSNGAYVLTDWRRGQFISLTPNPHFRLADETRTGRIDHVVSNDISMEVLRYRAGEIDATQDVPSTQTAWLERRTPDELTLSPRLGVYYLAINLDRPEFADRGVREALNMALERDVLTARITRGGEEPLYGLVPPSLWSDPATQYRPDWADQDRPTRIAAARALMEAAGYTDDNPLRVEIVFSDSDLAKRLFVATAAMWKDIHVDTRLLNVEPRATFPIRRERRFSLFRTGWVADYAHAYNFLEIYRSDAGDLNFPNYQNPQVDALLDAALRATPGESDALMREAEALAMADAPVIPLFVYANRTLVKPDITGWIHNPITVNLSRYLHRGPTSNEANDAPPSP